MSEDGLRKHWVAKQSLGGEWKGDLDSTMVSRFVDKV